MNRIHRGLILGLALVFLVGALAGCNNSDTKISGEKTGKIAPAFGLKRLDGSTLDLASLKGKVVLLDFWDTWCGPCRKALPHLQELSVKYPDQVVVIGAAFAQRGEKAVAEYVAKNKLTFEFVVATPEVAEAYGGIRSIPTSFIIDGDGYIQEKWVGPQSVAEYERGILAAME